MAIKKDQYNKIKEMLISEGRISTEQILKIAEKTDRKSAYAYLKKLEQDGLPTESKKIDKKTYYILKAEAADLMNTDPIDINTARELLILEYMYSVNVPVSIDKIKDALLCDDPFKSGDALSLDLSEGSSSIYSIIRSMANKGIIRSVSGIPDILSPSNVKLCYEPTTKRSNLGMRFNDTDVIERLEEIYSSLLLLPEGYPHYKTLKSAERKISFALGDHTVDFDDNYPDDFIVIGKKYSGASTLEEQYNRLQNIDYKSKQIKLSYTTRKGNDLTVFMKVGLLVYSQEQDCLYLIGETDSDSPVRRLSVRVPSVKPGSIVATSVNNDLYHNEKYINLYKTMFGISVNDPEEVEIHFDNHPYCKKAVKMLRSNRSETSSDGKSADGKLIYRDNVSGMEELARFLRPYLSRCTIVKPESLKQLVCKTIMETLKLYGVSIDE